MLTFGAKLTIITKKYPLMKYNNQILLLIIDDLYTIFTIL